MTKTDEIALLATMIKRFGPHSYLGPWLAEIQDGLVADITNDLYPTAPLPRAARAEAAALLAEANTAAEQLRASARDYADGIKAGAHEYATGVRKAARLELERLASRL